MTLAEEIEKLIDESRFEPLEAYKKINERLKRAIDEEHISEYYDLENPNNIQISRAR